MIWLYRLQQRLSITRHEGLAVITLTALFVTGLTVRHVQNQQVPPIVVDSLVAQPAKHASTPSLDAEPASPEPASPSPDDPLDLNTAPATALQQLNGIGPALSERIVRYRSTQRPFQHVEELKRVNGIGSKTLADLRPLVEVGASSTR